MSITAIDLYRRTRRYLRDYRDLDSTTAAITDTTTTSVKVADTTIYSVRWPIEIDQETMIVRALADSTTLTVERGAYGSTAATHTSGTMIQIRPSFYGVEILDALNEAIQACYPLIYKPVIDTSLTIAANTWEYTVPNMPGAYNDSSRPIPIIASVELQDPGIVPFIRTQSWSIRRGGTPVLKFPNLQIPNAVVRINGYGPFPDLADYTATLDGLWPSEANYLPPIYAAASLLLSGEAGRVRMSSGAVDTREQANRIGGSAAIGTTLMNRFRQELVASAMPPMPRHIKRVL